MNHTPFENWILDHKNNELTVEQRKVLYEHLMECTSCQQLQNSWEAAREQMSPRRMIAPQSGFAHRWQATLAQKRIQQQRNQTRGLFLIFLFSTLLAFTALIVYSLSQFSLSQILVSGLITFTWLFIQWNIINTLVSVLFHAVPAYIPIMAWVVISTSFLLLGLVWALSIWRIFNKGVQTE